MSIVYNEIGFILKYQITNIELEIVIVVMNKSRAKTNIYLTLLYNCEINYIIY